MTERRVLFVAGSGREAGNSLALARAAALGLPESVAQTWLDLRDLPLPPFEDLRHSGPTPGVYPAPTGNAAILAKATMAASDIVFVAPVYWYALPAASKLYLDHWSAWLRVPGLAFKAKMVGKRLWLIGAHAGSQEKELSPLRAMMTETAAYMKMQLGGILLEDANLPGQAFDSAGAADRAMGFLTLAAPK